MYDISDNFILYMNMLKSFEYTWYKFCAKMQAVLKIMFGNNYGDSTTTDEGLQILGL